MEIIVIVIVVAIGIEEDNEVAKHIYFKFGFNKAIDKGHGDEFDPSEYTLYLKTN